MARLLALTTVACGTGTAFAEPAQAPTPPAAVQGGRTVLKDEDTVVVRAQEVWEDPNADTLHFEGQFDMRTPEWRILAVRATVYGAVNDPDRITVNGTPAKVWIQRSSSDTGEMETIYGEGAQLEYGKAEDRLVMRGEAVLIEQGNRLTSAIIEYDLSAERFKASGQQGVEIVVEADRVAD